MLGRCWRSTRILTQEGWRSVDRKAGLTFDFAIGFDRFIPLSGADAEAQVFECLAPGLRFGVGGDLETLERFGDQFFVFAGPLGAFLRL